jgi:RNA polymerase sigma-70 factor (ECF subfamily)
MPPSFHDRFIEIFDAQFGRLQRYLDRVSGDPELAADLAQEALVKLYMRGSLPDVPEAWLVTVGVNLYRNAATMGARRKRLLTVARAESVLGDPPVSPGLVTVAADAADRVRAALEQLSGRDQQMLLMRAEGYRYHEIAAALSLNEGSVGTLLARAKRAFRAAYDGEIDAPR